MRRIQYYLFLFLSFFTTISSNGQDITYFHKIEKCTADSKLASVLYQKLDSIKLTRRQQDSKISIVFSRDIDFGYRHQRITVTYNSIFYQVNLIVKNDSIYFSSVLFDHNFYESVYNGFNAVKLDTSQCERYLELRNKFYKSSRTISDIVADLNLNEDYSFYCGDGSPKTSKGKHIEDLASNHKIQKLWHLLGSLSCEEQAYGYAGLKMVQKGGYNLPSYLVELMTHIRRRNSELLTCEGCLSGILQKEFSSQ